LIVHLYAQCWNDEWMLPYFFRHYDALIDRYFIYDDGSTDATWSILESHPKVDARRFERSDPESFVLSEQAFSNQCWKRSRGHADWVVVTDIDEHLVHPAWHEYLEGCKAEGVTMVPALGFQMIGETVPRPEEELALAYRVGAPQWKMMKASIFDPDALTEIRYKPGRHVAKPLGKVTVPPRDEMVMLHYKYLGFDRTFQRHIELRQGLGDADIENGWGLQYAWSEAEFREDWDEVTRDAVDWRTAMRDPAWVYPIEPWWEPFRP
jgi:hypothetical protein